MNDVKRFYTIPEAAGLLRMSPATLYREIAAGRFPAVKVRTRLVIPAKAIDEIEQAALDSVSTLKTSTPG